MPRVWPRSPKWFEFDPWNRRECGGDGHGEREARGIRSRLTHAIAGGITYEAQVDRIIPFIRRSKEIPQLTSSRHRSSSNKPITLRYLYTSDCVDRLPRASIDYRPTSSSRSPVLPFHQQPISSSGIAMSNLFAPPPASTVAPKPDRVNTPEKAKAYEEVFSYFSNPELQIRWIPTPPGEAPLSTNKKTSGSHPSQVGPLDDYDRMYLVCRAPTYPPGTVLQLTTLNTRNYFRRKRISSGKLSHFRPKHVACQRAFQANPYNSCIFRFLIGK